MIPQDDMDVLNYGSASHALLLDTDPNNVGNYAKVFSAKLGGLVRKAHREMSAKHSVIRSVADVNLPTGQSRIPLLRSTSLESFLSLS